LFAFQYNVVCDISNLLLIVSVSVTEGKPKKKAQKNDSDASLSSNDAQGKKNYRPYSRQSAHHYK